MAKYLLDSVILIDHFNGISHATEFIKEHYQECVISVITRAEVLTGFDDDNRDTAIEFLDKFNALIIDVAVADLTAKFRQQYRIKLPDSLQISLAIHHNLILVSRNTKDFKENHAYLGHENVVLNPYCL
ncbi:MAG: PIN domain-containing protein [Moraxella sp.]|nr:PIN domain-containing protein [Moraxella sp.]